MSQFINFAAGGGGGGGSPVNPNNTFETKGFQTSGALTNVQSGAANAPGATWVSLGTTAADWAGFWLIIGQGDQNGARILADLSFDGATVKCPKIYHAPGAGGNGSNLNAIFLPMNVPAGTNVRAKHQCNNSLITVGMALRGIVRNSDSPPMFNNMVALTADTTNTRASTVLQTFASTPTWGQIIASTAQDYGALLAIPGQGTVDPVANQDVAIALATGAMGSEVEFWRQSVGSLAANSYYRNDDTTLITKAIAAGSRISASPLAPTPGTMNVGVGLYGFY